MFRATRAEHGHSLGEQIIYMALWRESGATHTIQIGYDRLAGIAAVNWKTARACLRSLEAKLAIETVAPESPNERTGRTYRVYSFAEILERRRAAGMEWIEKGRGVRFLKTGTVPIAGTVPVSTTVPENGGVTVPETGTDTVPVTGTPLGIRKENGKEASSSGVSGIVAAVRPMAIDDDAARLIVRGCRVTDPGCTLEEIAHFAAASARRIAEQGNARNPVGLLISQVPRYFPGTELTAYRERLASEREAERTFARQVEQDPESTPEELKWAKERL